HTVKVGLCHHLFDRCFLCVVESYGLSSIVRDGFLSAPILLHPRRESGRVSICQPVVQRLTFYPGKEPETCSVSLPGRQINTRIRCENIDRGRSFYGLRDDQMALWNQNGNTESLDNGLGI